MSLHVIFVVTNVKLSLWNAHTKITQRPHFVTSVILFFTFYLIIFLIFAASEKICLFISASLSSTETHH